MMSTDDNAAMANGEPQDDVLGVASPPSEPVVADDVLDFAAAPAPPQPDASENVPPAMDLLGFGLPALVPTNGGSVDTPPPMDLLGMVATSPSERTPSDSTPAVDLFGAFDAAPTVAVDADEPMEPPAQEDTLALPEPTEGSLLFADKPTVLPDSTEAPSGMFNGFQEPMSSPLDDATLAPSPAATAADLHIEAPPEAEANGKVVTPGNEDDPLPLEEQFAPLVVEAPSKPTNEIESSVTPIEQEVPFGVDAADAKEEEPLQPGNGNSNKGSNENAEKMNEMVQEEAIATHAVQGTEPALELDVVETAFSPQEALQMQDEPPLEVSVTGEEEPTTKEDIVEPPVQDEVELHGEPLMDEPVVDDQPIEEPVVAESLIEGAKIDERFPDKNFVEETVLKEPLFDESVTDDALIGEPLANEPLNEPLVNEIVVNDELVDEPLVAEPIPFLEGVEIDKLRENEALVDETLADEPMVDEPLVDEPLTEEEFVDAPLVDEPLLDERLVDEPLVDEPLVENFEGIPGPIEPQLRLPESPKPPPKPVADVAPSWMSTAATPTGVSKPVKPQALKQRTPSAAVVELPPIEPISYASSTQCQQEEQGPDPATQALIVDLQASIQEHLNEREAANERARKAEQRVKELQGVVQINKELEQELHETKESLNSSASDREHLLVELDKLREARDEHERKQIVLSNRLNAAKKKEAAKANLAESLDDNVKVLKHDYETAKKKSEEATDARKELAKELANTKENYEQRLKKTETQLSEERRLNDERKKKMKSFVENKQEEIRESKSQNDELNMELSQTNRSLREHHSRWKQLHAQWVQSQTRNRELQRDINRMKKESESMSRLGERMNVKMSQSAQETEEHKTKRLTAKQELMNVLEALESERDVSSKLRDSIKFTFTPKALSQQQILKESLREFEHELARLSMRLGRPLPPSNNTPAEVFAIEDDDEEGTESSGSNRRTRSEIDSTHLLANLEDETQRVSQCIMALTSNIERLHIVVAQSGERTCVSLFSDLLSGASGTPESGGETAAMTGPRISIGSARSYGQVPTATN